MLRWQQVVILPDRKKPYDRQMICPVCPPGSLPHAAQMGNAIRRALKRREVAAAAAERAQEHARGLGSGEAPGSEEAGASGSS
jgi:hypothetical protein